MPEDHVDRIGGLARLSPDPQAELAHMRELTNGDEFAEWLAAYESGGLVIVALDLFADVRADRGRTRIFDDSVHALSFMLPHGEDNLEHAREVVRSGVEALSAALGHAGLAASAESLLAAPVEVEMDGDLTARLAGAAG
jgi:hypothetical protein